MFSDCLGWILNRVVRWYDVQVLWPLWPLEGIGDPAKLLPILFSPFGFCAYVFLSLGHHREGPTDYVRWSALGLEAVGCRNTIWKSLFGFLAFLRTLHLGKSVGGAQVHLAPAQVLVCWSTQTAEGLGGHCSQRTTSALSGTSLLLVTLSFCVHNFPLSFLEAKLLKFYLYVSRLFGHPA